MADIKFSQFAAASAITGANQFVGLQGGLNVRYSATQINAFIQIDPDQVNGIAITQADTTDVLPQGINNFYLTTTGGATDNLVGMPNFDALSAQVAGALFAVNNLSDVSNRSTSVTNLGLHNGYQAFGNLDYILTNPSPTVWDLFTTAPGHFIQLAPADQTTSMEAGRFITVQHGGSASVDLRNAAGVSIMTLVPGHYYKIELTSNSILPGTYVIVEETGTVNGLSGNVILTGNNINSTYTAINYTPTSSTIDGNLQGIDNALGSVDVNVTLQDAYDNGPTITLNGTDPFLINSAASVQVFDVLDTGVVVGNGSKAASSIFDIFSTTQGSRPYPSMTTTQRDAIATPATGLTIYNTVTNTIDYYNGSTWISSSTDNTTLQDAYDNGNSIALDGVNPFLITSTGNQIIKTTGFGTQTHSPSLNAGISTNLTTSNMDAIFYNDPGTDSEVKVQVEPGSASYPENATFQAFRVSPTNFTITPEVGVTFNGGTSAIELAPGDLIFGWRKAVNDWWFNINDINPVFQTIYDNSPLSTPVNVQLGSSKPIVYEDSHGNQFFSLSDQGTQSSKVIYPLLSNDTLSLNSVGTNIVNQSGGTLNFSVHADSVIDFPEGTEFSIIIYEDAVIVKFDQDVEVNSKATTSGSQDLTFDLPFQKIDFQKIAADKWVYTVSALLPLGTDYAYGQYNVRGNGNFTTVPSPGTFQIVNINPATYNTFSGKLINFQVVTPGSNKIGLEFIGTESTLFQINFDGCFATSSGTGTYQIAFGVDSGSGAVVDSSSIRFFTATTSFADTTSLSNAFVLNQLDTIYLMISGAFGTTTDINLREGSFTIESVQPNAIISSSSSSGVTSWNSMTGVVSANSDDVPQGSDNIYLSNDGGTTYNLPIPIIVSGTSQALLANRRYLCTNAALTSLSLPTTNCTAGSFLHISGSGSGLFSITQASGQSIVMGTLSTTTGATGHLDVASSNPNSAIELVCITDNTSFMVINSQGNFNLI